MDASARDDVLDARYELKGELGRDREARVHRAWDRLEQREVAVKVFKAHAPIDPERLEHDRALVEAAGSPVLVRLLDAGGPEDSAPYVVSELVRGESLAVRLAGRAMQAELVRRIGLDVATALAALHGLGAAHGRVSPTTVLVPAIARAGAPAARLAGFGVAGSGTITDGAVADPSADVHALGLVLLECLTGPDGFQEAVAALADPGSPLRVPARTPAGLAGLVRAMTDPEPGRRPSAADVAQTLRSLGAVAATLGSTAATLGSAAVPTAASMPLLGAADAPWTPPAPEPLRNGRPRHRLPWFAAVGTSGAAAAGIVLLTISASVLQPQGSIQALPRFPAGAAAGSSNADRVAGGTGTAAGSGSGSAGAAGPGAASTVRTAKQDALAQLVGSTATASTAATAGVVSLAVDRSSPTSATVGGVTPGTPGSGSTASPQAGAPGTPAATPSASSSPTPSGIPTTATPSPSTPASPGPSSSPSSPSSSPSPTTSSSPSSTPSPKPSSQSPSPQPPSSTPTSDPAPSSTPTSDPAPSSTPTSDPAPSSAPTSDPAPSATSDPAPSASSPSSDPAPSATSGPAPTDTASVAAAAALP